MKMSIREFDYIPDKVLRQELERELSGKLSGRSPRVTDVSVSVRDVNGPRGGIDQEILVIARLATGDNVVVRERSANVLHDFPATIRRVVRAARRELGRRRRVRRVGFRRNKDALAA